MSGAKPFTLFLLVAVLTPVALYFVVASSERSVRMLDRLRHRRWWRVSVAAFYFLAAVSFILRAPAEPSDLIDVWLSSWPARLGAAGYFTSEAIMSLRALRARNHDETTHA